MKKGFTLLELIIVVIILGILIAIALPRFTGTRLRAYSSEALNILGTYRASQIRYFEQKNVYATGNPCVGLDTAYTTLKYHTAPDCSAGAGSVAMAATATYGSYTLSIDINGVITCAGATDCPKIGY